MESENQGLEELQVDFYIEMNRKQKCLKDFILAEKMTELGLTSDLGKGTFGSVKLVRDITTNQLHAMKIVIVQ